MDKKLLIKLNIFSIDFLKEKAMVATLPTQREERHHAHDVDVSEAQQGSQAHGGQRAQQGGQDAAGGQQRTGGHAVAACSKAGRKGGKGGGRFCKK